MIGTDAIVHVDAPPADGARGVAAASAETLHQLLATCHDALQADVPLPVAVRIGVQHLLDPARARAVYEGSGAAGSAAGEGAEACLARLYPDHAALVSSPGFDAAVRRQYAGYADWLAHGIRLEPLPDADPEPEQHLPEPARDG